MPLTPISYRRSVRRCAAFGLITAFVFASHLFANSPPGDGGSGGSSGEVPKPASFSEPALIEPRRGPAFEATEDKGVNWGGLIKESFMFLGIQHSFRLATEPGTRQGMKGPFFRGYADAVGSLHGIADGDEFYVNYVGHPMQGASAGFIWVQNDRRFREAEFGQNREYWKSRLRATAFSMVYSLQFEMGPLSEASIGKIQSEFPQQGFIDHIVTPAIGMSWMLAEDALDKYFIKWMEQKVGLTGLSMGLRIGLNPSRSFANVMRFKVPWYRDSRGGVYSPQPWKTYRQIRAEAGIRTPVQVVNPPKGVPPFEFTTDFRTDIPMSGGYGCLGGSATAAFRLSESWQLIGQTGGCKMVGLSTGVSGSSLTYMVGPRRTWNSTGKWIPHVQLLAGGQFVMQERMFFDRWEQLRPIVEKAEKPSVLRGEYVTQNEANAFAISLGAGVAYKLNNALGITVAEASYRRSWMPRVGEIDFRNVAELRSGLVLRFGTW